MKNKITRALFAFLVGGIFFAGIPLDTWAQTYCIPSATNSNYYINSFSTTGGTINITNNNTGYSPGGYGDYTASDTVAAVQTSTIDVTSDFSSYSSWGARIWVDWNIDGDFTDPGEEVFATSTYVYNINEQITVPLTATPGNTRMRIRVSYIPSGGPDVCSSDPYYGEAEDYVFKVLPMPPCASATFPTSVTASIDRDTLCVSGEVTLDLDTAFVLSGVTYQWQSAGSAGGPWTDLGTAQATPVYTATNVSTDTWYRCQVLCNGTPAVTSNTVDVYINDPQLTGTQGGSRCGPGTVDLSATAAGGASVKWYDVPTGGQPLGTGSNFTTPYITQTTDFYAAANTGGGTSTGNDSINVPLSNGNTTGNYYHMFTVHAINQISIVSMGIKCNNSVGTATSWDVYYRPDDYTTVAGANTSSTGWTLISSTTNVPSMGSSAYTEIASGMGITIPAGATYSFYIEPGSGTTHQYSSPSTGTVVTANADAELIAGNRGASSFNCTVSGGMATVNLKYGKGCESPRQAVTATVTPGPAFDISYDTVVCNDAVTAISVSSPLSNYTAGYSWHAVDSTDTLYSDAAGTIPYTPGTNLSTVYFRSDVSGMHRVAVHASNGTAQTDCAAADTADIWVQPGNIVVDALPDTICVSGSSELTLDPDENYAAGTIQWQVSDDGVAYTDISGATAVDYTTPVLGMSSTDLYYRAVVSAVAGTCETPSVALKVSDPAILTTTDSFHCDPGSVTLLATASPNSTIRWYEEPTGTDLPIGTGSPFQTPFLAQTDTFYVAAGAGALAPPPTFIGSGTATTTSSYSPFYQYYEANKVQMLFTAAELQAQGFTAGMITAIGFKVAAASGINTYENLNIKMKNTTVSSLSSTWETGLTTVYTNPAFDIQANMVNDFQLTTPFQWDGSSNIVIEVCYASSDYGTTPELEYTSGLSFTATHYNHDDGNLNHCTNPTGYDYTTSSRVNVQITMAGGCESARQPVIAHIYPNPNIDLGDNINECIDSGQAVVLDAGLPPYNPQYLWENGSTNQVRAVDTSGIYSVTVTNSFGCVGGDTISVILRENPEVDLGDDTTVCEGSTLPLDAGDDGIEYFWNTGETSSDIVVDAGGTYTVLVTNAEGCITADTINVTMSGQLPSIDYILPTNNGAYTFTYTAVNPQNVNGYEWDFGDGSPVSYAQSPTHTYPAAGNYIVTLKVSSACGYIYDSTAAHIVGITGVDQDRNVMIYPNPTRGNATISVTGAVQMEQIAIFDMVGKQIRQIEVANPKKHTLQLNDLASGLYTIQIETNKGTVIKKLEIIR